LAPGSEPSIGKKRERLRPPNYEKYLTKKISRSGKLEAEMPGLATEQENKRVAVFIRKLKETLNVYSSSWAWNERPSWTALSKLNGLGQTQE
jgi:hypothetical protein